MTPRERQQWIASIKQTMRSPIPNHIKQQYIQYYMHPLADSEGDDISDAYAIIITDGISYEFAGEDSLLCLAVSLGLPEIFNYFVYKINIGTVMCDEQIRCFLITQMISSPLFFEEVLYRGYGPQGWRTPESMLPIQNPTWLNYLLSKKAKLELDPVFAEEAAEALMPGVRMILAANENTTKTNTIEQGPPSYSHLKPPGF